jgi:two-component system sensor histidine kinase MtrB
MADALAAKIDALSEAEQRERRFTSDVAHELRTPLAGMSMAAGMLAEHLADLPPDGRRCAEILIHDTVGLQALVLELLELARIDAQSDPVEAEPVNLRTAMVTVAGSVPGAEQAELRIAGDLVVNADRARFRRVMTNLLTNAVVHGAGPIEVGARRRGGEVVISVRDHGPGIPPEVIDRIFDRFFKADSSRSQSGTGLGLAIAAEHARAQRGSLTAANAPDGGAVFTLVLPAAQAAFGEGTDSVAVGRGYDAGVRP